MHPFGPGPGGQDNVFFYMQEPGSPNIEFMHAQLIEMHELIKGAPYTATAVTESTQVLGDGNRIVNKHSGWIRVRSSSDPRCNGTTFLIFLPAESATLLSGEQEQSRITA